MIVTTTNVRTIAIHKKKTFGPVREVKKPLPLLSPTRWTLVATHNGIRATIEKFIRVLRCTRGLVGAKSFQHFCR